MTNGWLWGLAGVAVVGAVGAAVALSGESPAVATERGYKFLPGCGGIEVSDEPRAMAFARSAGTKASKLGDIEAWAGEASEALGGGATCTVESYPVSSLGFLFRLVRAYVLGAVDAQQLLKEQAQMIVSAIRVTLLARGVAASELPEL